MASITKEKPTQIVEEKGVPLLDLGRQHQPLLDELTAAIRRVCQTGAFVLGPEVKTLEQAVAAYCGVKHAIGCASGSDALLLALMACDIGPGDEVILPSFTFFATASAVTRLGGKPVFADIDPETFNVDPSAVKRLLTPATKAILPVHLFGQCAEMGALNRIANSAEVSAYRGRRPGHRRRMGGMSCRSHGRDRMLQLLSDQKSRRRRRRRHAYYQ